MDRTFGERAIIEATVAEAEPPAASAPERVVSINLCTDQPPMMLAARGQLVSVRHLATDPRSSAMAEEAAASPATHARAEEIYPMDRDLVLAGADTATATVGMLTRMGVEVEVLQPPCAEAPPTGGAARMAMRARWDGTWRPA